MIGVIFNFGTETVEVRIDSFNVFFRTSQFQRFADIDGIKLDKQGVIKEFPELKDREDWQEIGRKKFKEKINKMKNEEEVSKYIIKDLTKFGYQPLYFQKQGFRPVKL